MQRRIVGIELIGEPLAQGTFAERWPVVKSGRIGDVLVALYSPRLEKNIGYAMVLVDHSNLGSTMTVETAVGTMKAKVVEMPFVKSFKA